MKKRICIALLLAFILSFALLAVTACSKSEDTETVTESGGRKIPVYQGMTISKQKIPTLNLTGMSYRSGSGIMPLSLSSDNNNGNHNGHYKGDHTDRNDIIDGENPYPENEADETIEQEIESSLNVVGSPATIYYATPNEDIYINIHIDNPDSFEILSFTLNGKKYSGYMFEDGSDMETIILKYNVGNSAGIVEYTIDAIKYVDGTEIKDVIIEGNKTVKAGVKTENQVAAGVTSVVIDTNALSFNVNLKDPYALVEFSGGALKAVLYDGSGIVAEQDVALGDNAVTFEGLATNTLYQYAIVGYYDNLSGEGFGMNLLHKEAFYTDSVVLFDRIVIGQESVDFGFLWHEDHQGKSISSMKLYAGETLVKEVPANASAVTELLSDTTYQLVAEYPNAEQTESISIEFTTLAKAEPDISVHTPTKTQTAVGFTVTETDADHVGAVTKIELVHASGTVLAESPDQRSFTNLLSNNTYTIRITYTYDLNDGTGAKTVVKELVIKTDAKAEPDISVHTPTKTQTSLGFTITETDSDNVGAITKIELLHGSDTPVVAENTDVRNFTDLLSNNTYTVKVTYVYNLNDGAGDQTVTKTLNIKTQAKTAPAFSIQNESITDDSLKADYTCTDPDGILASYKVELYKGSALVSEHAEKKIDFSALDAYTDYTVKITYTYDLNDGVGTQTATKTLEVKTLPFIDVTACTVTNTEAIASGDTIVMRLDLNNPSGVNVTHVTVSGEKYAVNTGTAAFLLIHIPCDESFPGGEATLTVETLEGTLGGKTYTLTPATEASQTVFINGNLTVLGIEFVNESMEPVFWAFPSDTVYLMIRLENPTGYTVDRVTVNGTAYTPTKLSDNEYYCAVPLSSGSGTYTLSALSYRNENLEKSLTLTETCDLLCVNADTVQYVSTPEDLLNMNGGYYELTGDVDLSGKQWQGSAFSGVLNGKGYAVKNLTYIGSGADGASVGLFSTAEGLIWNLSLENVNLLVGGERGLYVGALAGSSSGDLIIDDCHISGRISVGGSGTVHAGGMVGFNNNILTITNSTNSGDVSGYYAGGLVGYLRGSLTITNSTNSGTVSGGGGGGGLAGGASSISSTEGITITITDSTNSGAVSGTSGRIGGLVGYVLRSSVTITSSTNSGAVSGTNGKVGGMVGYAVRGSVTITNSTNNGTVTVSSTDMISVYAGGLVGKTASGATVTITNSTNSGAVTGSSAGTGTCNVGGLVGYAYYSGKVTITNSTNSGTVSGTNGKVGGLVGSGTTVTITNSYTIKAYNTTDVLCTVEQLNTPSFYTDTLGWSLEIWDLSDLDVANGKYPKLK